MNVAEITPLILTFNEAPNIGRCLQRLAWASRVVVVDSGSSDDTLAICRSFLNVDVVIRPFDDHTNQWNFGIDAVETEWVLSLDADYIIEEGLQRELALLETSEVVAYFGSFRYVCAGSRLHGTLYPDRAILFSKNACRYASDGHTQLLAIEGNIGKLRSIIDHDDRKPLSRWLDSQRKYAALEAEKLMAERHPNGWPDRLRKMIWPAAPAAFVYTLFVKRLVLDGWPGLFYALQRTYAEMLLSLELLERKLTSSAKQRDREIDS